MSGMFKEGYAITSKDMASKTRPSKLCGFCIFHTETCEPLIEKWFVCYAFFNVSENGKANYQNTNNINVNI